MINKKNINVIAIGDNHFKVDNIQEVDLFIERITELVTRNQPDFVVLLGDLLDTHERLHVVALNRAYKFINEMRLITKTFILVGNHDMTSNQCFLTDSHWLNALKDWNNVVVVDKIVSYTLNSDKFILVPYVSNGRFVEALNTLDGTWTDATCIFAHQEFYGCKMGAFNSIDGDVWDENLPNIISGHIHLNQLPQKNIYYPGSSLPVAFGESSDNIIANLTFNDDKTYDLEEIGLNLPKKKIIYINSEDIDALDIPVTEDKIKLSISGEYEDFKLFKKGKKYKELNKQGVKIVFKPKRSEIKSKNESIKTILDNNLDNFHDIIRMIIEKEKNSDLFEAYELIINSKDVNSDDILLL